MRPKLNPDEVHDIPFTVRFSAELHDFIESEARRRDIPKTIIIREYLVEKVRAIQRERNSSINPSAR